MRRINQYEEIHSHYENLMNQIQKVITFSTERMKQIDASGHFESDDEVGFFFDELKNIQLVLDNLVNNEEIEDAK